MLGTAPGLLSLLSEKNEEMQEYGLKGLMSIIDTEWPQIADQVQMIEDLANNGEFKAHKLASLLASNTYYHLDKMDMSLKYALLSGDCFDYKSKSEYTMKVISYAIGSYIKGEIIGEGHKELVKNVLNNLVDNGDLKNALSLSIETRSTDCVNRVLDRDPSLVTDAIPLTLSTVTDSSYRHELLSNYVDYISGSSDLILLCKLFQSLHNPDKIAEILIELYKSSSDDDRLLAYQICFDLAENATQEFRTRIYNQIPSDMENMKKIITRSVLLEQYMMFLFTNNERDHSLLVTLKETLDTAKMMVHTSVVLSYMYMFAGTAEDHFYRDNSQWFSDSKKWSQYVTAAAIGVIHMGHLSSAMTILQSFFNTNTQEYVLGGALYALGIIFANYTWNSDVIDRVIRSIRQNQNSAIVRHGASLALGLISIGSQNKEHYEEIRNILYQDEPDSGEAAGYGMGMIMLGSGACDEMNEMLAYANNTEHEKIIRGTSMGLAFMMYGCEDKCETLVHTLLESRQPLLRTSAAWVTALAYVGTGNNTALHRLLHMAVSDVNPDVRRAAVIGVGFVLSRRPGDVPAMLDLLAKSYHPHVRSGAALAIGISCAGTGNQEAIELLKPLLTDIEDFVKQSAMMSMAMVLQQQSDMECPYCIEFRKYLRKHITRTQNDLISFGLCTAYGILNASGRNVVISCNSLSGENSVIATVGLAMFCNFFYWHPLSLMLPLAFHPTAVIGLDINLKPPEDWEIFCGCPASKFANPPRFEDEREKLNLGEAAKLSVSRQKEEPKEPEPPAPEPEPEEEFHILKNSCRVTLNQLKYIDFTISSDYEPVTKNPTHGFTMLRSIKDK